IQLFTDEKTLQKTINRVVTDSRLPGEPKPLDCTINKLYKLFATEQQAKAFEQKLSAGLSWGEAKKELFEVANEYIKPMREKFDYYQSHHDEVDKILQQGAKRAKEIASAKLQKIRSLIGVK
ncbi:MAG: tryptophan--tRNA ligase, partial [Christensenellales bacterium]